MDLNQLKTFYILAQTKNYSHCAKKLFVTQSAVSHSIKKLETSIGCRLIDKKGSEFQLTREGYLLFASCRKVFPELEAISDQLSSPADSLEEIRLGSPIEFGVSILIKSMNAFFSKHPAIHVDFHLGNFLFNDLMEEKIDLLIDCKTHQHIDIKTINLFREEYAVVASPEYLSRNSISKPADLAKCNVLSMDKELVWWDNFIRALPLDRHFHFTRITVINHVRGMINAAVHSLGVGFVPKYTILKELEDQKLVALFPEIELLEDIFRIYIKAEMENQKKYQQLIEYLKELKLT